MNCITLHHHANHATAEEVRNMGPSKKELSKIRQNPEDVTIRHEFMRWVNKGSSFEKGLTRRRDAEANLYYAEN